MWLSSLFKPFVRVSAPTVSPCKVENPMTPQLSSTLPSSDRRVHLLKPLPKLYNKPMMYRQCRLFLNEAHSQYHTGRKNSRQTMHNSVNPGDRVGINCCYSATNTFFFFFWSIPGTKLTQQYFQLYIFMFLHRCTVKSSINVVSVHRSMPI